MYHKSRYVPRHPQKYRGDPTNVICRSSWERRFYKWCDENPSILEWSSEEIVIPYLSPVDKRLHRYFPDAWMKVRSKDGVVKTYLVEIKPETQTKPPKGTRKTKRFITETATFAVNTAKWKAAEEFCNDRKWQFMIITERHLGIK